MTHKNKVCQISLATHIETCEKAFTYTPLQIPKSLQVALPHDTGTYGIRQIVAQKSAEMDAKITQTLLDAEAEMPSVEELAAELRENLPTRRKDILKSPLYAQLEASIESSAIAARQQMLDEVREAVERDLASDDVFGGVPMAELAERRAEEMLDDVIAGRAEPPKLEPMINYGELPELGFFFTEEVCLRGDGQTTGAEGYGYSVIPGEVIKDSWSTEQTYETDESEVSTQSSSLTLKDSQTQTWSFSRELSEEIKRTTDLKFARSASLTGKLFKVIDAKLSGSGNFNFNKMINKINATSSSEKREFVTSLARKLTSSTTLSQASSYKETRKASWDRKLDNTGKCPQHFIDRNIYNVYSVFHKRVNAHLAWSGCLDNPAEGLCVPGNIEEDFADDIQAIRDKWAVADVPASFGQRPENKIHNSGVYTYESATGAVRDIPVSATIPGGWSYVGNPVVNVLSNTNTMQQAFVLEELSSSGTTGGLSFMTRIDMKNNIGEREVATFIVSFEIAPLAAATWDAKAQEWRDTQAQAEIDSFIAEKREAIADFYQSNRFGNHLKQRILKEIFGIDEIEDCCRFLARLERIFNFEEMCFSLLPSWNAQDDGCAQSQDVSAADAKCAHYFVPIHADREAEALALLAGVGVIPWTPQIAAHIWAAISQIQTMRDTEFTPAFDPTGWAAKIDKPLGYQLTPYDTTNTDWDTGFENKSGRILLDAFVVAVPNGGVRTDVRGHLCDDHCTECNCED